MKKNQFLEITDKKGDIYFVNVDQILLIEDAGNHREIILQSNTRKSSKIKSKQSFLDFNNSLSANGFIEFPEDMGSNYLLNPKHIRCVGWNKNTDWKSSDGRTIEVETAMRYKVYMNTLDMDYIELFPSLPFKAFIAKLKK